jgi:hypothetical protein
MNQEQKKTIIALDIDQTLAGGVVAVHLRHYNEQLGLEMTEEQITAAASYYSKTFDVPQIMEYRKKNEENFQKVRSWIRTSSQVHHELELIAGSKEGVHMLAESVDGVGYFTVRPIEVSEATASWLVMHGFPQTENLVICTDHAGKIKDVLATAHDEEARIVLIDDSLKELLIAATKLAKEDPSIQEQYRNLVLVGFGYDTIRAQAEVTALGGEIGIDVYALTSWSGHLILDLLTRLELPSRLHRD